MLKEDKLLRIQRRNYRVALVALAVFLFAKTLVLLRYSVFGVIKGHAPTAFAFNVGIYFPVLFLSMFLAAVVLVRTLWWWDYWVLKKHKTIALLIGLFIWGSFAWQWVNALRIK